MCWENTKAPGTVAWDEKEYIKGGCYYSYYYYNLQADFCHLETIGHWKLI